MLTKIQNDSLLVFFFTIVMTVNANASVSLNMQMRGFHVDNHHSYLNNVGACMQSSGHLQTFVRLIKEVLSQCATFKMTP